jgi:hypothetical protein
MAIVAGVKHRTAAAIHFLSWVYRMLFQMVFDGIVSHAAEASLFVLKLRLCLKFL